MPKGAVLITKEDGQDQHRYESLLAAITDSETMLQSMKAHITEASGPAGVVITLQPPHLKMLEKVLLHALSIVRGEKTVHMSTQQLLGALVASP